MAVTNATYGFSSVFPEHSGAPDPFAGVKTRNQIERIYRRLAKSAHPDVGGSNRQMYELNEARAKALLRVPREPRA